MEGAQPAAGDLADNAFKEKPTPENEAPTEAEPSGRREDAAGEGSDTRGRGDTGECDAARVGEDSEDSNAAEGGAGGEDGSGSKGVYSGNREHDSGHIVDTRGRGDTGECDAARVGEDSEDCNAAEGGAGGEDGSGSKGVYSGNREHDSGHIVDDGDTTSEVASSSRGSDAAANAGGCDAGVEISNRRAPTGPTPCSDSGTSPAASGENACDGNEEGVAASCASPGDTAEGASTAGVEGAPGGRSGDGAAAAHSGGGRTSRLLNAQAVVNAARSLVSSQPVPAAVTYGIYVNYIPLDAQENEIKSLFEPYGEVQRVFLVKKPEYATYWYAYVLLDSDDNTRRAISALNGVRLRGNRLKVETTFGRATHIFAFGEGTAYNRSRAAVYGRMRAGAQDGGGSRPPNGHRFRGGRFNHHQGSRFDNRWNEGFRGRQDDGFRGRQDDGFRGRQDDGFRGRHGDGFRGRQDNRFNSSHDQQPRYAYNDGYSRGGSGSPGQQRDNFGRGGGTMQRSNFSHGGAAERGFRLRGEWRQWDNPQDGGGRFSGRRGVGGDNGGYDINDEAAELYERHVEATRQQRKAWDRRLGSLAASGGDCRQWPTFDQLLELVGNTMYALPLYRSYNQPSPASSVQDPSAVTLGEPVFWRNGDHPTSGGPMDLIRLLHGDDGAAKCLGDGGAADERSESTAASGQRLDAAALESEDGRTHVTSAVAANDADEALHVCIPDTGDRRSHGEGRQRESADSFEDLRFHLSDKQLEDDAAGDSGDGQLTGNTNDRKANSFEVALDENAPASSNEVMPVDIQESSGLAEGSGKDSAERALDASPDSGATSDVSGCGGDECFADQTAPCTELAPPCHNSVSSGSEHSSENGGEPRTGESQLSVLAGDVLNSQPSLRGSNSESDLFCEEDSDIVDQSQRSFLMGLGLIGRSDDPLGGTGQRSSSRTQEEPSHNREERMPDLEPDLVLPDSPPPSVDEPQEPSAERGLQPDTPFGMLAGGTGRSPFSGLLRLAVRPRSSAVRKLGENERLAERPETMSNNRSFVAYSEARRLALARYWGSPVQHSHKSGFTDSAAAAEGCDSESDDSSSGDDDDGTLPKRTLSKSFVRRKNERNAVHLMNARGGPRCAHRCVLVDGCQPVLLQGGSPAPVISECQCTAPANARPEVSSALSEGRALLVPLGILEAATSASEARVDSEVAATPKSGQAVGEVARGQQAGGPTMRGANAVDNKKRRSANLAARLFGSDLSTSSGSEVEGDEGNQLESTSTVPEDSGLGDRPIAGEKKWKATLNGSLNDRAPATIEASSADGQAVEANGPTPLGNAGNNTGNSRLDGTAKDQVDQTGDDARCSSLEVTEVAADHTEWADGMEDRPPHQSEGRSAHCGGGGGDDEGNGAFEKGAQDGGAEQQRRSEAGSEQQEARSSRDVGPSEAGGGGDVGDDDTVDTRRRQPPSTGGEEIECEPVLVRPSQCLALL